MDCEAGPGVDVITDKGTLDAVGLSGCPNARCFLAIRPAVCLLCLHPTCCPWSSGSMLELVLICFRGIDDHLVNPYYRAKYQATVWAMLRDGGLLVGRMAHGMFHRCRNVLLMHDILRAASFVAADVTRCLAAQIITSCNSTQEELEKEFCSTADASAPQWAVVDHVRTHPKFKFGGIEGSKVATVAFLKLQRPEH